MQSVRFPAPTTRLVKLQAHAPGVFGGCDLKVEGTPSSLLTFRFPHPATGNIIEHKISIEEALQAQWQRAIDEQGNVIAIERQL